MTHRRKTIRDAVVALLDTGTIVASGKVYSNRTLRVAAADAPYVNVYTQSETSQPLNITGKTLARVLTISIEAVAKDFSDATLDDTLDTLAEGIETALRADEAWAGSVFDSTLIGTEIETSDEGDTPLGRIRLTYSARYRA